MKHDDVRIDKPASQDVRCPRQQRRVAANPLLWNGDNQSSFGCDQATHTVEQLNSRMHVFEYVGQDDDIKHLPIQVPVSRIEVFDPTLPTSRGLQRSWIDIGTADLAQWLALLDLATYPAVVAAIVEHSRAVFDGIE